MRLLFSATAAVALCIGCTHDFAQYVPTGDGGSGDGSSRDAADGCAPPQGCFDTATTCGGQCKNQRDTCTNQCGGNNQCRSACFNTEKTCRTNCATTCATCTTNAGCRAESQCTTAANK